MNLFDRIKFTVFAGVFGVGWGVFEMIVGGYFHMINFPLRGALMAGAGCVFMSVLRFYVRRSGVNLIAGLVACAVKLFSFGSFKIGPVVGIFIESVIIECVFSIIGFNRFSIYIACLLAVFEGVPHFFITNLLMYGKGIFDSYIEAGFKIAEYFGFSLQLYFVIFVLWIMAHLIIGFLSSRISIMIIKRFEGDIY